MYDFKVVPDFWRNRIPRKKITRNMSPINDPVVQAIMEGKTVLVDAHVPLDKKEMPYKNLYNALNGRGYRLRMYMIDDLDLEIYRGLIMWAEPFVRVVACPRCGNLELTSDETMPTTKGCASSFRRHRWRDIKKTVDRKDAMEVVQR